MSKLTLWEKVRQVPPTAKREIQAGRLKGKTDINPMWRIKLLTEIYGPCGTGWRYEITRKWTEQGGNSEIAAFVDIDLYVKDGDEWSHAIPGTGGSMLIANERNGLYTNDECYKMALTDAISVACKALGVGADVYWDKDSTKYDKPVQEEPPKQPAPPAPETPAEPKPRTAAQAKTINEIVELIGLSDKDRDRYIAEWIPGRGKVLTLFEAKTVIERLRELQKSLEGSK